MEPGRGKVIYWNILQDFPRGLNAAIAWSLTAGGGPAVTDAATTGMEFIRVKGGCYGMGDNFDMISGREK